MDYLDAAVTFVKKHYPESGNDDRNKDEYIDTSVDVSIILPTAEEAGSLSISTYLKKIYSNFSKPTFTNVREEEYRFIAEEAYKKSKRRVFKEPVFKEIVRLDHGNYVFWQEEYLMD